MIFSRQKQKISPTFSPIKPQDIAYYAPRNTQNTSIKQREGGRTVRSGRVATIYIGLD